MLLALFRRLIRERRGSAAVEFAMSSIALFAFMMAIVNLGYLGLLLGILQRGVQGAARQAATTAAANLSGAGAATTCPTAAAIKGYFAGYTAPTLNSNNVTFSYGAGTSAAPWVSNDSVTAGSYLTLTATYTWKPIGLASAFSGGIPFRLTAAAFVMGTGNGSTC